MVSTESFLNYQIVSSHSFVQKVSEEVSSSLPRERFNFNPFQCLDIKHLPCNMMHDKNEMKGKYVTDFL